jgi:hypothetical protein
MKSPAQNSASDEEAYGLWRDGQWLVIDLAKHRFPRRCLKTNQPVDGPPVHATFTEFHLSVNEREQFRKLRVASSKAVVRTDWRNPQRLDVKLLLPLLSRYRWLLESSWIPGFCWFGFVAVIASIFAMNDHLHLDSVALVIIREIVFGLAVACFPLGIAMSLIRSWIVRKRQIVDRKIWLAGVHRDWLAPLPPFVATRALAERCSSHAFGWSLFWLLLAAIFVGLTSWRLSAAKDGYRIGRESRSWLESTGSIVAAEIRDYTTTKRVRRGTIYHLHYAYEYPASAKRESGVDREEFYYRQNAEQRLATIRRLGQPLTVYYNPANPSEHRLQRGFSWTDLRNLSLAGLFASLAALFMIKLLGRMRDVFHWQRHLAAL